MEENSPDDIHKLYSQLNKAAEVKECFHHKKDECGNRIINAHSISRGKRLELIKGLVNNNEQVYSLSEVIIENGTSRRGVKPVGWKMAASTFFGFCNKHDDELFKLIEDGNKFNNSPEQCFLHSYRSFAYTYHSIKKLHKLTNYAIDHTEKAIGDIISSLPSKDEVKKLIGKAESECPVFPKVLMIESLNKILIPKIQDTFRAYGEDKAKAAIASARESIGQVNSYQDILELFDERSGLFQKLNSTLINGKKQLSATKEELDAQGKVSSLQWMGDYKASLDYMIEHKLYDGLKYYTRVKEGLFPFACAFAFSPDFLYAGLSTITAIPSDPKKLINACLMVTVLPDESNKTIILFSCFKEDPQSIFFLDKLFSLRKEEEFERAVTSIIIGRASNVFLNPSMWEKLGIERQTILEQEINQKRPTDELPEKPFMSKLNFFDAEFVSAE